jgi:hypothetical protein
VGWAAAAIAIITAATAIPVIFSQFVFMVSVIR